MNFLKSVFLVSFFCLAALPSGRAEERRILILGDSLTKGEGLMTEQAFPALLGKKMTESGNQNWTVLNGGVSGDTTAGGLRRLTWLLGKKVDILVVALGANDGLRGVAPAETDRNLQAIIDKAKAKHPDIRIIIAGMQMPDNFGKEYVKKFREVFPEVAKRNNLPLIPFLLEGVGGVPELNLPDLIHPNQKGQEVIAETVWKTLQPMINN